MKLNLQIIINVLYICIQVNMKAMWFWKMKLKYLFLEHV